MKDKTCRDRINNHFESRMEDLRKLWDLYQKDSEASDEELGNMYEYGLSFDYVAPETFKDQEHGYFRYQLSWGGPSDEFRIFVDDNLKPWKIEYWFMDWFDGARKPVHGNNLGLLKEIFQCFFVDSETARAKYEESMSQI